ncbi:hypothetical protein MASR2M17_21130 [Aminivibrio sp.]
MDIEKEVAYPADWAAGSQSTLEGYATKKCTASCSDSPEITVKVSSDCDKVIPKWDRENVIP